MVREKGIGPVVVVSADARAVGESWRLRGRLRARGVRVPVVARPWNQSAEAEFLPLVPILPGKFEGPSMTSQSATTIDHDQIRRWVEARDGTPAAVRATEAGDDPGILRIRFSDESADDLDAIG